MERGQFCVPDPNHSPRLLSLTRWAISLDRIMCTKRGALFTTSSLCVALKKICDST